MKENTENHLRRLSVIVPVYNAKDTIAHTVDSLLCQTLPHEQIEIILVDDGSKDGSAELCDEIARENTCVRVIHQPNKGVSAARNTGIESAQGKFLAFVDSDDSLLPDTLEAAVDFFDQHYDEIDLLSYPMQLYDGKRSWSHVREEVLSETGIYDLTKIQNAFALITNVNVIIKNLPTLPRFDETLAVHEDEAYFMEIILEKLRIGFSKEGAYCYLKHPQSATSTLMSPLLRFEPNMAFWEEFFARYTSQPPLYLQASFFQEVKWKTRSDILLPHDYSKDAFEKALCRLRALINRLDNDLLFTAPRCSDKLLHYIFSLKESSNIELKFNARCFYLTDDKRILLCRNHIDATLMREHIENDHLVIEGRLESWLFAFSDRASLLLHINGSESLSVELHPAPTELQHYHRYEIGPYTQGFTAKIPLGSITRIEFEIKVDEYTVPIRVKTTVYSSLNLAKNGASFTKRYRTTAIENGFIVEKMPLLSGSLNLARSIRQECKKVKRRTRFVVTAAALLNRTKRPLWLYCGTGNYHEDPIAAQFLHDVTKDDGITRRCVVPKNSSTYKELLQRGFKKSLIPNNTTLHRIAFAFSENLFIGSSNEKDWAPYSKKSLKQIFRFLNPRLILAAERKEEPHFIWRYGSQEESYYPLFVDREQQ